MRYIIFVKHWILIKYYYRSYKNENSYRKYRETSRERSRDRRERERSKEPKIISSLSNKTIHNNNNYKNYNYKKLYYNIINIEQIPVPVPVPVYCGVSIYISIIKKSFLTILNFIIRIFHQDQWDLGFQCKNKYQDLDILVHQHHFHDSFLQMRIDFVHL